MFLKKIIHIFFLTYMFSISSSKRISVLVPLISEDDSLSGFLTSIEKTANFHQLQIFLLDARDSRFDNELIQKHVLQFSNMFYIPLQKGSSQGQILNRGVELSTAPYLIIGTPQSRFGQYFFEHFVRELETDYSLDAVYSGIAYPWGILNEYYELSKQDQLEYCDLLFPDQHLQHTIMWRKAIVNKYGNFDETYHYYSDFEFFIRCSSLGIRVKKNKEILLVENRELYSNEKTEEFERICSMYPEKIGELQKRVFARSQPVRKRGTRVRARLRRRRK